MSHKPSVLVIASEFWPTASDASLRLVDWAHRLQNQEVRVTVASQRPDKLWPEKVTLGTLPVVRFLKSSGWASGQSRYYRKVADWIQRHAEEFDYFYFDNAGPALAAVFARVCSLKKPIVLRFNVQSERQANFQNSKGQIWQPPKATVDFCRRANLIVAPNAESEQQLRAQGIVQTPIVRVPDRSSLSIERSIGARREARKILANVNMDLAARSTDRVLLCPGRINEHWRIADLIDAVTPVVAKFPGLRVWIHGDGPNRLRIAEEIRAAGVGQSVLMPGVFTDMHELFQAADACVFPGDDAGLSFLLPTCLKNRIPVLLPQSKPMVALCGESSGASYFKPTDYLDLRAKVEAWLDDSGAMEQDALAMQTRFNGENEVPSRPRDLFDSLR